MKSNKNEIGLVELVNMEFYSYHGCFKEEQIIGNKFLITYSAQVNVEAAEKSDDLADALNYQELYNTIKEAMMVPSKLLENVAYRIHNSCSLRFPSIISAKVEISKLNPPIGGRVEASRVVITKSYK
ncbi:MAG: dihydroneopterin aldolase [Bacteroidales bacterium]|nr:dihydroneopterin aldolase [Bacteroidales bacterium]MDD4657143.1 dihydroneopterin aldolase [Bacteroidales bacterium]